MTPTLPLRIRILTHLESEPKQKRYVYALSKILKVSIGTLHKNITTIERDGLITSDRERSLSGTPPRRYFRLTESGRQTLRDIRSIVGIGRIVAPMPIVHHQSPSVIAAST